MTEEEFVLCDISSWLQSEIKNKWITEKRKSNTKIWAWIFKAVSHLTAKMRISNNKAFVNEWVSKWAKHGISIQCICPATERTRILVLQHWWAWKTLSWLQAASYRRPYVSWLHLHQKPRVDISADMEKIRTVSQGLMERDREAFPPIRLAYFWVMKMFWP